MPRRPRALYLKFDADPYCFNVTVICGASDAAVRQHFRRRSIECDAEDLTMLDVSVDNGAMHQIEDMRVVLRFRERKPTAADVAHEALHATATIMKRVGMPMSDDSEEGWCYLLDSIVGRVADALEK